MGPKSGPWELRVGYVNPLLRLPAAQKILALPDSPEKRLLEQLLRELRADADVEAEKAWKRRKGPIAAYWRAVSTYARHTAHAFSRAAASIVRGLVRRPAASDDHSKEKEVCDAVV